MTQSIRALSVAVAVLAGLAATHAPEARHFALDKSVPEADATVPAPSEIRLWFTQVPQEGSTSIRLVEADEAGVHVGDVMQDPDEPTTFYVELHGALPAGTYTVSWRGMGQDGHVIRDSFTFSVAAE